MLRKQLRHLILTGLFFPIPAPIFHEDFSRPILGEPLPLPNPPNPLLLQQAEVFVGPTEIPLVVNDAVLKYLGYYQTKARKVMERSLRSSGKYLTLFREIFEREELPLDLVYMPHVESLFNPKAHSRARAKGLWQFMKRTGANHGLEQSWWIDERLDIVKSTEAAARYLKNLYAVFGDWHLALAAYNVGPGRIERVINRYGPVDFWTMAKHKLLPRETINFVSSVLASVMIFRNPEHYNFHVQPEPEVAFEVVPLEYQVDLQTVSEAIDAPLKEVADLNPELLHGITPDSKGSHLLKVPAGKGEVLKFHLSSLPPERRIETHHRVRKGDTLAQIAKTFMVPIQLLAQVNHLQNIHRLKLGQLLLIPRSRGK